MNQADYLLEIIEISKEFPGVKALDNVSLRLRRGTIHALVGENGAGKSTLMKCLFGIYSKDYGRILINGQKVDPKSPNDALAMGVSMVHQELEQVRQRNVMDNVWLGRYPLKGVIVDEKKMFQDTTKIFRELQIDIDPYAELSSLTVSQRQMVDIAKAISYDCKVIVLDEPTSSLTEKEIAHLFTIVRQLTARGVGIVYISHKLEEIFELCQDITILRDGQHIKSCGIDEVTQEQVISLMVGRELTQRFPPRPKISSERQVLLRVENLAEDAPDSVQDINFELNAGEILGVAGLLKAGRTELLETIFGLRKKSSGTLYFEGQELTINDPKDAIERGFALCTEERRHDGLFMDASVAFNSTIADLKECKNQFGFLSEKKIKEATKWVIDSFNVKTPNQTIPIRSLSGGNQQKVIIGKWLLTDLNIILMDEPTRGIDVGAKYEIYQLIFDFAAQGKGVIVASSEMPELLNISDRILVLSNGRISDIYDLRKNPEEATPENIFKSAAKFL